MMNWIPCVERVPDDGRTVLAWSPTLGECVLAQHNDRSEDIEVDEEIRQALYADGKEPDGPYWTLAHDRSIRCDPIEVSHWTPLPPGPEAQK